MINIKKVFAFTFLLGLMACEKKYTCECKNPGGVYATYELSGNKETAKENCDKYNQEANSIPWSESFCDLK